MTPDMIFQFSNMIALAGWLILLIISPFWLQTDKLLIGIAVTLLCLVYTWLIFGHFHFSDMSRFGTLDGVMELFTDKSVVTAGWVHYLAFDLMTGLWIKRNSLRYGIPHVLVIPCLLFTFMLGPIGLLLYLVIRAIKMKNYFPENY